ncbi:MAG: hypothetical protein C4K49_12870 [Candidatus Thorarchaeota archaeon]|nr:MAG: hypothetical protein C4K49_12870 [Candidatus Thorarchaeota archaeon]
MIVTVTTVVVLVIGLLSLGLALYGGYVSSAIVEGFKGDEESRHTSEQRYYLLGMIGMVVLIARLFDVPLFFWMLQSLVPYCPGAMCAYGVVNAAAPYSVIDVVLKLLLPFAYGMWLVMEFANRSQARLPFARQLARSFLFVLLPLVILDSAMDILFVASIKPVYVPCCSSIYDVNPPFSPSYIFGSGFGAALTALTVAVSIILVLIQWVPRASDLMDILTAVTCGLAAIFYVIMLHDSYAPLLLGIPTHHCPYCLFQEFPDTAFFSGLFWLGIATVGWRIALQATWKARQLALDDIRPSTSILRKVSSVAILFSMASLVSHLLLVL